MLRCETIEVNYTLKQPPMRTKRHFFLFSLGLLVLSYCKDESIGPADPEIPPGTAVLPTNIQPRNGDAQRGWDYLRTGDFIGGGIPLAVYNSFPGNNNDEADSYDSNEENDIEYVIETSSRTITTTLTKIDNNSWTCNYSTTTARKTTACGPRP